MDSFGQWVYDLAEGALSLLPDSPFIFLEELSNSPVAPWLKWLNWFIPVNTFIAILTAWAMAILVYYVVSIVLRWAKAVE